jgi:CDP-6-deoxy-D-xylo-4-hexulose-3-dehydrase
MGTFSSFFSHHISTMEGGLVVTDDEEIYHILLSLRAHGWTRNLPKINHVSGQKSDDPFVESFRFVLPGFNFRPLELSGAIGIEQVKKLPKLIEERRKNGRLLQELMHNHDSLLIQKEIGESSWFGISLVIKPGSVLTRKKMINDLNNAGFEVRPIVTGNFVKNDVVKYFDYEVHGDLINANHIDSHGLFLGNHHYDITDAVVQLKNLF